MADIVITEIDFFRGIMTLTLAVDPPEPVPDPQAVLLHLAWNWRGALRRVGVLRFGRIKARHDGTLRGTVPLPDASWPLLGVTVTAARPNDQVIFQDGLDNRIVRLFPRDDEEYVSLLQSHLKRWGNEKTRYYLSEQVVRHFSGAPEHRIGAVLIMAYKAVEIGDEACIAAARSANRAGFDLLQGLSIDWHPRRNREHLEISLLTTQWHLELAAGDIFAMRQILRRILPLSQCLSNYATPAYSASKGLLLLGWLEWRLGDTKAAAICWHQTVAVFKNAVRDADPYKAVLFRELTHSLDAAHLAGLCLRAIPGKPGNHMPTLEQVVSTAARVAPYAKRRLEAILASRLEAEDADRPSLADGDPLA